MARTRPIPVSVEYFGVHYRRTGLCLAFFKHALYSDAVSLCQSDCGRDLQSTNVAIKLDHLLARGNTHVLDTYHYGVRQLTSERVTKLLRERLRLRRLHGKK